MSPEAQAIRDIITAIKPELWWTLGQVFIIGLAVITLRNIWVTLAAYIAFRTNKDIGKHVKVSIKGREGIITHFTIRFIFIRFKDNHNELIIPMRLWENRDWELIKNGNS